MRLIDADELVSKIDELSEGAGFYKPIYEGFSKAVKNQPTIDAVPVVRCKDCKYHRIMETKESFLWWHNCKLLCADIDEDDFCSYGERKDGAT